MIKAIIFDFDHTLYDRDATYDKMFLPLMDELADYIDDTVPKEELLRRLKQADKDGHIRAWPTVYEKNVESGVFRVEPTFEVFLRAIRRHHPSAIVLWDDTVSTLVALREGGYKLGILTNGGIKAQQDKLSHTSIVPYFDAVIIAEMLPHGKPHATAFYAICEKLGVLPSEAAYVGDHPLNDIEGAKKAGLTAIWIPYAPYPDGYLKPDHTINRLGELPALIKKINESPETV